MELEPPDGVVHSYDKPFAGVTVAYVRDRGEDWDDCRPLVSESEEAYWSSDIGFYGYLFKDGVWFVKSKSSGKVTKL
jgi:hypothetical protein